MNMKWSYYQPTFTDCVKAGFLTIIMLIPMHAVIVFFPLVIFSKTPIDFSDYFIYYVLWYAIFSSVTIAPHTLYNRIDDKLLIRSKLLEKRHIKSFLAYDFPRYPTLIFQFCIYFLISIPLLTFVIGKAKISDVLYLIMAFFFVSAYFSFNLACVAVLSYKSKKELDEKKVEF